MRNSETGATDELVVDDYTKWYPRYSIYETETIPGNYTDVGETTLARASGESIFNTHNIYAYSATDQDCYFILTSELYGGNIHVQFTDYECDYKDVYFWLDNITIEGVPNQIIGVITEYDICLITTPTLVYYTHISGGVGRGDCNWTEFLLTTSVDTVMYCDPINSICNIYNTSIYGNIVFSYTPTYIMCQDTYMNMTVHHPRYHPSIHAVTWATGTGTPMMMYVQSCDYIALPNIPLSYARFMSFNESVSNTSKMVFSNTTHDAIVTTTHYLCYNDEEEPHTQRLHTTRMNHICMERIENVTCLPSSYFDGETCIPHTHCYSAYYIPGSTTYDSMCVDDIYIDTPTSSPTPAPVCEYCPPDHGYKKEDCGLALYKYGELISCESRRDDCIMSAYDYTCIPVPHDSHASCVQHIVTIDDVAPYTYANCTDVETYTAEQSQIIGEGSFEYSTVKIATFGDYVREIQHNAFRGADLHTITFTQEFTGEHIYVSNGAFVSTNIHTVNGDMICLNTDLISWQYQNTAIDTLYVRDCDATITNISGYIYVRTLHVRDTLSNVIYAVEDYAYIQNSYTILLAENASVDAVDSAIVFSEIDTLTISNSSIYPFLCVILPGYTGNATCSEQVTIGQLTTDNISWHMTNWTQINVSTLIAYDTEFTNIHNIPFTVSIIDIRGTSHVDNYMFNITHLSRVYISSCTQLDKHAFEASKCYDWIEPGYNVDNCSVTINNDISCVDCDNGYYKHLGTCTKTSSGCAVGEYFVSLQTTTTDIQCESCKSGTYMDEHNHKHTSCFAQPESTPSHRDSIFERIISEETPYSVYIFAAYGAYVGICMGAYIYVHVAQKNNLTNKAKLS